MRNIYLFISCLLSVCMVQAQEFDPVGNITPAAPEAAQFQKYGDIPVSYYSGTPNISIPLYTVQSYDVTVPIGLSYHASGVKLTEMASWVGTGWSLSAGGMLSRSVRGRPDFTNHLDESSINAYFHVSGGYPAIPTTLDDNDYGYVREIVNQTRDVQPDEYYINFLGRSVKFYIKQNKEIITDPSDRIKIEAPTASNLYWVVTDASGTRYTFGSSVSSREITKHNNAGGTTTSYVSSWYLKEIKSATNHSVTFDYQRAANFTHLPNQRHHNSETLTAGTFAPEWACDTDPPGWVESEQHIINRSSGLPYQFKPVKLTHINFERGGESHTVEFIADNSRNDAKDEVENVLLEYYKLNFINVRQGANKRLTYTFDYDNLTNGLWLRALHNVSYDNDGFVGGIEETHHFDYDEHTALPHKKSYDMDYWGLYNGAGNILSTLLSNTLPGFASGADRSYNFNYAKKGILTKITYPTGGFSAFEYEPHVVVGSGEPPRGLRIKKITSGAVDGPHAPDTDLVREFIYKEPGSAISSGNSAAPFGVQYQTTVYHGCSVEDNIKIQLPGQSTGGEPVERRYTYDNMIAHSSHSVNGSGFMSIGYLYVQELIGEGGSNGRNVYEYSHVAYPFNEAGYTWQGYQQMFSPLYLNSFASGRLKRQLTQKRIANNGNESDYQTQKEVVNTWAEVVNTSDYVRGLIVSLAVDGANAPDLGDAYDQTGESTFLDIVAYASYRIKPDWVRLASTVETTYEGTGSGISRTTDYTHGTALARRYQDFATSQKVTYGVSGDEETTVMTYPFNAATDATITALRNKYMMPLLSSVTWTDAANTHTRGGGKTSYQVEPITGGTIPLPAEQFQITQGNVTTGGLQDVLQGKFLAYNSDGLPTVIENALGHKTSLKWHHDLLLASCSNANADEFFFEGFEYGSHATSTPHTGKKYYSGNYPVAFTAPVGRSYKVSYWYLSSGTWMYKEKAFSNGMQLTEGSAIDDVRVYPTDGLMTTYTHDTFFGLTSQSGPNNRPMYYIYDAAGRLKLIKDQDGKVVQAYDHEFLTNANY